MGPRPPAKFEYDLMQFLSAHEGLSVRDVFEQFGRERGYIRGTIVKAMDRLLKKNLVERELVDGTYVYRTRMGAAQMEQELVGSFIAERLGGKLTPIASFLSEAQDIDPEELKKLREALDALEG